jgi:hypothetical protein
MPYMKFCGSLVVVLVSAFVSTFAGCTLTQGGTAADGGVTDTGPGDVGPDVVIVDSGPDVGTCTCPGPGFHCTSNGECGGYFATCNEMHTARKALPSGLYQFAGPAGLYFAYCDMDKDNGGWTLVGRSVASSVQPPSGFGWLKSAGDPSLDANPYSFDMTNYTGSPTDALVGLYTANKTWGTPVYKIALPPNFVTKFLTVTTPVTGSAIVPPACGATLASNLRFAGFTSNAHGFFFNATGTAPDAGDAGAGLGGLGFGGFDLGAADSATSGGMHQQQGQIFVR